MAHDTNSDPEVVCVGNIVADIVPDPMPRLPEAGELTLTEQTRINMGGCGATTAAALVRLGVRTSLVTAIGDDGLGELARAELERLGVATSNVIVARDTHTSKNIILLVEGQDRRYIYTMGATAEVRAGCIDADLVASSKFIFVGGYLLMPNLVQDELVEIFRAARKKGVRTALDVAAVRSAAHRKSIQRVLTETDYFLPNQDEAEIITGVREAVDQALAFRDMGVRTAVITCGGDGAIMVNDDGLFVVGAHEGPFVDGTGAGDCFDAGFICALLHGEPEPEALLWGSACGASCVRNLGGTTNLMTRDQVRAFVANHPLKINTFTA